MSLLGLAPGQIVAGKYTVQATLGRTPNGITVSGIMAPGREIALRISIFGESERRQYAMRALKALYAALATVPERFVLPPLDTGEEPESSAIYVVSPLSSTPSLAQLVELCPLSLGETTKLTASLANSVDAFHAAGIAHLALKPSNVFVGTAPEYSVRVADFGSPLLHPPSPSEAAWLAPEQLQAGAPSGTAACDVFASALLAYFALTGRSLLTSTSSESRRVELAELRVSSRALELELALPPALDSVFARALAAEPQARYASVAEFAAAFRDAVPEEAASLHAPPTPIGPLVPDASVVPIDAASAQPVADWSGALPTGGPRKAKVSALVAIIAAAGAVAVLGLSLGAVALHRHWTATSAVASSSAVATAPPTNEPLSPPPAVAPPPSPPPATDEISEHVPARSSAEPRRALSKTESEIVVECTPQPCTMVLIDGKRAMQHPHPIRIRPGRHGVGASRPGFGGQWKLVNVVGGERETLQFALIAGAAPPPQKKCGKFLKRCD